MLEPYIVLSPVGNYMDYILDEFISAAQAFNPPPEEIVLCIHCDHHFNLDEIKAKNKVVVRMNPEMSVPDKCPPRMSIGREILRNYFIHGPEEVEHALWIDTDIICPPETPSELFKAMERGNYVITVNRVASRGKGNPISGAGVMLTHRMACTIGKFFRGYVADPDGVYKFGKTKFSSISEDFMFFTAIRGVEHILDRSFGKKTIKSGNFVEVEHKWR